MQTRGTSERKWVLLITCFCLACCFALAQAAQAHDPKSDPSFKHLNKAIDKLERGVLVTGLYVNSLDPTNAVGLVNSNGWQVSDEVYTKPAIDFLFIELEYEPFEMEKLRNFLLALNSRREVFLKGNLQPNLIPIVNLPTTGFDDFHTAIKQVLDLGVFGVWLSRVQNAEEAKKFVQSCRYVQATGSPIYEPRGTRSFFPFWASYLWGLTQEEYMQRADPWPLNPHGELMLILHIEDKEGVENIDSILDVLGFAGVTFGPLDYSFTIGRPHDKTHPQVKEAEKKVKESCKRHGVNFIEWVDETDVKQRLDEGYKILVIGSDTNNDFYGGARYGNRGAGKVLDYLRQRK
jgi:4-hydroxy-2-oxoheptanedioate aldolase